MSDKGRPVKRRDVEAARKFWEATAKRHGWHRRPFHVQVWIDADGSVVDSVSFRGITRDIFVDRVSDREVAVRVVG